MNNINNIIEKSYTYHAPKNDQTARNGADDRGERRQDE